MCGRSNEIVVALGVLRPAHYWYLRSNKSNALEVGIVITQVAFEHLTGIMLPSKSYKKLKSTAFRLHATLEETGIDSKVFQSCQELGALYKSNKFMRRARCAEKYPQ